MLRKSKGAAAEEVFRIYERAHTADPADDQNVRFLELALKDTLKTTPVSAEQTRELVVTSEAHERLLAERFRIQTNATRIPARAQLSNPDYDVLTRTVVALSYCYLIQAETKQSVGIPRDKAENLLTGVLVSMGYPTSMPIIARAHLSTPRDELQKRFQGTKRASLAFSLLGKVHTLSGRPEEAAIAFRFAELLRSDDKERSMPASPRQPPQHPCPPVASSDLTLPTRPDAAEWLIAVDGSADRRQSRVSGETFQEALTRLKPERSLADINLASETRLLARQLNTIDTLNTRAAALLTSYLEETTNTILAIYLAWSRERA